MVPAACNRYLSAGGDRLDLDDEAAGECRDLDR
jgi:hypothetical protein